MSLPSLRAETNDDLSAGPNVRLEPLNSLMWCLGDADSAVATTAEVVGVVDSSPRHRRQSKRGRDNDGGTGDSLSDAERARRGLTVDMVLQCCDRNK